jgi:beta-mannosidase
MKLDGVWELLPTPTFRGGYYSDENWLTVNVPGHWQQQPDLEFYAGKAVYRKRFDFKKEKGLRYRLRLNGVFYFYIAYLNGYRLGENEGYFFPREFDITQQLKDVNTPNELVVEVECPDEKNKSAKHLITGVFSHWDCLDPKTNPGGIWQSVEILTSGPQYIADVQLRPTNPQAVIQLAQVEKPAYFVNVGGISDADGRRQETPPTKPDAIELRADFVVNSGHHAAPVYRLTFTPYNFTQEGKPFSIGFRATTAPGDNRVERFFALENPQLWWSHDLGEPRLYTVRVETFADELMRQRLDGWEFRWGLRHFELKDWQASLNGVRLFLKGNNYPPGDTRIATMTKDDYLRDFRLAKNAHMNFMRIHAHLEKRELFDAADELGMLLWQDFPLQWSYAHEVLPQAERQAALMPRTFFNHPSIAIWCMHNEPMHISDTQATGLLATLRAAFSSFVYSWDRMVMDTRLKKIVEQADPTRPVIRASGKWSVPWMRDADSHFYFGWYKQFDGPKRRFELIKWIFPSTLAFVTEFGAQSFPQLASCVKFMDADIKKIDWAHLVERHHFQPNIMADWYDWRACQSLQELIELSQAYQIEINQYYIDWLRYHKYQPCGGIAPFMFHDSNPAVQWSILDYWRAPKKSYHAMRVAFNPEYVFTLLPKDAYRVGETLTLPVYVVNDARRAYERVNIMATVFDANGTPVWQSDPLPTTLEADCKAKLAQRITFSIKTAGTQRLVLRMEYGEQLLENEYRIRVTE